MFDVSSASGAFTTLAANISSLVGTTFSVVLPILAALLGLGFAIGRVRKWIAGRKA